MLTPQLLLKFMQNTAFEKNSTQSQAQSLLNQDEYKDLMITVFENCGLLNLCPGTSYLAKIYLDIILNKSNQINYNQLSLLSFCCIWIALKFNQPFQVSKHFNVEVMCQLCQNAQPMFSVNDLIEMELKILLLLQFKLRYTTPHDYIQPFFQSFPWMLKAKTALKSMFQVSGAISQLRSESSGDIFYASFVGILELKKCTLQPLQKSILSSQIRYIEKIKAISWVIMQRYNQLLQYEQKDENGMQSEQTQAQ